MELHSLTVQYKWWENKNLISRYSFFSSYFCYQLSIAHKVSTQKYKKNSLNYIVVSVFIAPSGGGFLKSRFLKHKVSIKRKHILIFNFYIAIIVSMLLQHCNLCVFKEMVIITIVVVFVNMIFESQSEAWSTALFCRRFKSSSMLRHGSSTQFTARCILNKGFSVHSFSQFSKYTYNYNIRHFATL